MQSNKNNQSFLSPLHAMVHNEFNALERCFNNFFRSDKSDLNWLQSQQDEMARMDIMEDDKAYKINASLPGFKKEDITLDMLGNTIYISGKYKNKNTQDTPLKKEILQGSFSRSFNFPKNVDCDSVEARMEDGILKIIVNKKDKDQSFRKIYIN